MQKTALSLTRSALVGAIYFILSLIVRPIEFGPVQFRVSEALVMLPVIMPESVIGVTVGCLLANLSSPYGLPDILFGTLATLISALLTARLKRHLYLAALPPIIVNALVIPAVMVYTGLEKFYLLSALYVGLSEAVTVFILGIPLVRTVKRHLK